MVDIFWEVDEIVAKILSGGGAVIAPKVDDISSTVDDCALLKTVVGCTVVNSVVLKTDVVVTRSFTDEVASCAAVVSSSLIGLKLQPAVKQHLRLQDLKETHISP